MKYKVLSLTYRGSDRIPEGTVIEIEDKKHADRLVRRKQIEPWKEVKEEKPKVSESSQPAESETTSGDSSPAEVMIPSTRKPSPRSKRSEETMQTT